MNAKLHLALACLLTSSPFLSGSENDKKTVSNPAPTQPHMSLKAMMKANQHTLGAGAQPSAKPTSQDSQKVQNTDKK